jgi:carboxymethylenebutenolidase
MKPVQLLVTVILTFGVAATLRAQIGGVRGVVNRNLQGVGDYNQSIEDAMNGKNDDSKLPPPVVPGAIKSGWLTCKSREASPKDIRLFFAYPAALTKAKPAAGLIVLQEWWGVNDDMQQRAKDLAAKGFYAIAPDLFNGKVTDDATEAAKLKDSMTDAYAMTAMKTGLDLLQEEEGNGVVDAKRVGALGWCMGGQQSLLLSLADPRVKATALFYGPLVTDSAKLKSLQGPVFGIFGNDDKAPSPDDVKKFQDGLKAAGKSDVTIYQFDGVGHAFASKSAAKMGAYDEAKANDAFTKLYTWLDAKLPR